MSPATPTPAVRFSDWQERVRAGRVLVVGDVMLDRYWFGDVERISPEAPVPVVRIARTEERPGGAANVARNAAALGARTALLSVVGADEARAAIERLVADDGITASLYHDPSLPTTVKLRVIARQQQLLRIDFETRPSQEVLSAKLKEFGERLRGTDVVVLSDYGAADRRVLVDPKGDDWARYRGASLVTPNRSEFRDVAGRWRDEAELTAKAEAVRRDLDLEALLVTRSEEGMSLYTAQGALNIPAQAREVYDVSGAGDTVIATMAALIAAGASLADAVCIANEAAGVVVGKLGTAVVHPSELA